MGRQVPWRWRVGDGPISRYRGLERVVREDPVESSPEGFEQARRDGVGNGAAVIAPALE